MFEEITKLLDKLNALSNYYIEIGLLNEDKFKTIAATFINLDNTQTTITLPISDALYLNETGSLIMPARPIVNKLLFKINTILNSNLSEIIQNAKEDLAIQMKNLEFQINTLIPRLIDGIISEYKPITNVSFPTSMIDLAKIKNFIKCKIYYIIK